MKEFQVQRIAYIFNRIERKMQWCSGWERHKDYLTLESATDALRDKRNDPNNNPYNINPYSKIPSRTNSRKVVRWRVVRKK